jgi:hypothetical protein
MFARYFIEVPLPTDQVERALLDSPTGWLSALAGAAQERGDGLPVAPLLAQLQHRASDVPPAGTVWPRGRPDIGRCP